MNINRLDVLKKMDGLFTTVGVSFSLPNKSGMVYTYLVPHSMKVEQNDVVCVQGGDRLSIGYVISVHESPQLDEEYAEVYKWVVGKVDTTEFEKILDIEEQYTTNEI